jgi:hypothetical protein
MVSDIVPSGQMGVLLQLDKELGAAALESPEEIIRNSLKTGVFAKHCNPSQ